MTFRKILVALDGSENSEKVLGPVSGLAGRLNAELVLLAVVGFAGSPGEEPTSSMADAQTKEAAEYLESQAARLKLQGLTVSTLTESGMVAEAILAVAERENADLIAMATHRENVIERGILGSITDNVLRSAEVPVLAINPDRGPRGASWVPSMVIVPLDGSDLAEESVPAAIEIAKACGAGMVFIEAVHLPSFAVSGPGAEYYAEGYGVSSQREEARKYLSQFVKQAEAAGVQARVHAALGNAAARIIEESRHEPDALIVITSHGRSGFRRMVLGSVADKIVRSSHHPVLVMKHGE